MDVAAVPMRALYSFLRGGMRHERSFCCRYEVPKSGFVIMLCLLKVSSVIQNVSQRECEKCSYVIVAIATFQMIQLNILYVVQYLRPLHARSPISISTADL